MKWASRIFFVGAIVASLFFFGKYGSGNSIFTGDALGYYSYLPSYFCLHNLDSIDKFPAHKNVPSGIIDYFGQYARADARSPKGYAVNQYTVGVALFELPFFVGAHIYTQLNGINDNGYSRPYHYGIMLSNFFYLLLGLFFCFKIIRQFFSLDISLLTISVLLLTTNLFWFANVQFGMAHPIIFFLVALLIHGTLRLYAVPHWKNFVGVGVVLGCITLVRPTDVVFALIPIFYGIKTGGDLRNRWRFIIRHYQNIAVGFLFFILPILPQLFFWKNYTTKYFYDSYAQQGFDFLHPKIWEGLLGPSNGWLLYSPLWVLCLLGFFNRKIADFKWPMLLLTPIYIYIIYSWWCYQYINGFGSRPMIHLYPLLIFPLATAFELAAKTRWRKALLFVLLGFFTYHNLHYSYIQQRGKYSSQDANYAFYVNSMFKDQLSYNDLVLQSTRLKQPQSSEVNLIKELGVFDFSDTTKHAIIWDKTLADSVIYIEGDEFPAIELRVPLVQPVLPHTFIKASCAIKFSTFLQDPYFFVGLVHTLVKNDEVETWHSLNTFAQMGLPNNRELRLDSIYIYQGLINHWDTIDYYIPIPPNTSSTHSKLGLWNTANTNFSIQFIKLELYQKK